MLTLPLALLLQLSASPAPLPDLVADEHACASVAPAAAPGEPPPPSPLFGDVLAAADPADTAASTQAPAAPAPGSALGVVGTELPSGTPPVKRDPPEPGFASRLESELVFDVGMGAIFSLLTYVPNGTRVMGYTNTAALWWSIPLGYENGGYHGQHVSMRGFIAEAATIVALGVVDFQLDRQDTPKGKVYLINTGGIALGMFLLSTLSGGVGYLWR